MDHVGPITFVFGRFIIASLAILPIWFLMEKPTQVVSSHGADKEAFKLGIIMSVGMLLQQIGLLYTTVGRAGFLTALYIVFVPLLGLFMGSKTQWPTWMGVGLSVIGVYFLSRINTNAFFIGDGLMLLSAVTWAQVTALSSIRPSPIKKAFVFILDKKYTPITDNPTPIHVGH